MPKKNLVKQAETGYTCYNNYLTKGMEMLDSMTKRYHKVLQTRMDFRYPQDRQSDGSNKDFSKALQGLAKELNREGDDPQYLGRREQKDQANQHYHLNILTNAKKHESRRRIIEKAERHWGNSLGLTPEEVHNRGLVDYCDRDINGEPHPNGYTLIRGADDYEPTKHAMIRQMSYLTKYDPDDTTPSSTRKFFASQYRKDEQKTVTNNPMRKKQVSNGV